jgi:hypothetical protein
VAEEREPEEERRKNKDAREEREGKKESVRPPKAPLVEHRGTPPTPAAVDCFANETEHGTPLLHST